MVEHVVTQVSSALYNQYFENTHTHSFNGSVWDYPGDPVPEGKTNLDLSEARDGEWQWHQLSHIQVCTSLQTDTPAPHHSVFTGRLPFLSPNQQRQSTEKHTLRTEEFK